MRICLYLSAIMALSIVGEIGTAIAAQPLEPKQPKSYSIPVIDISGETARQVVVARGTERIYHGHVHTLLMPDGKTMWAVWTYGHGGRCGPMKKSGDGGLTWSELLDVPDNWRTVYNCPTIHRLIAPDGKARLFVFAGNPEMRQAISEDEGQTWSEMKKNGLKSIVAPITIEPVENGKKLLMWHQRGPGDQDRPPMTVWQSASRDGGLTWGESKMICAVEGGSPCEPACVRSPDGKQLLLMMRENLRRFNSLYCTSDDEGRTWSPAKELPAALTGDRHMPRYAPDGRLVVVMRDKATTSPTKHFVGWVGQYKDIVEGREGQYRVKLLHNYRAGGGDCGYPGLEVLPDGTLAATTYVKYRPGPERNSIVSVRFKLPELDAKAASGETVEAEPIDSRLEPLVDDHLIERLDGAALRLHRPTPREIVLKFDRPWEGPFSGYVTVLKDADRYRMYYRGLPVLEKELVGNEVTCYAESADGVHWTKPDLGLFEVRGTKQNNVVLARHPACHNFTPMLDANPLSLAGHRYKALGRTGPPGLLAFVSPDGIHWKELGKIHWFKLRKKPLVTQETFDSQNVVFWSASEGRYVCYFRVFEDGVRWIARMPSKNFLEWYPPVSLSLDGRPRQQLYTNQLLPYIRAPHVYLGMPMRFFPGRRVLVNKQIASLGTPKQYVNDCADATFISTRGGSELKRTFLEAFIRPGLDPRGWTSRAVCPAHGILQTGPEELSIYVQQHTGYPSAHLRRYTLRPDGFASVNAPFAGGEMTTKPLRFSGDRLAINFSTSAAGSVRVEIQGADGKPIPGYSLADCPEIIGDQIERTVSWKGGPDLSKLAGRPVRLRFALKDADLFAIQFL